jgi:hypothetical protein
LQQHVTELEQDILHCQTHHLPPTPPSKSSTRRVPKSKFTQEGFRPSPVSHVARQFVTPTSPRRLRTPRIPRTPKTPRTPGRDQFCATEAFDMQRPCPSPAIPSRDFVGQFGYPSSSASASSGRPVSSEAPDPSTVDTTPSEGSDPFIETCNQLFDKPRQQYQALSDKPINARTTPCMGHGNRSGTSENKSFSPLGYLEVPQLTAPEPMVPESINTEKEKTWVKHLPRQLPHRRSASHPHLRITTTPYNYGLSVAQRCAGENSPLLDLPKYETWHTKQRPRMGINKSWPNESTYF